MRNIPILIVISSAHEVLYRRYFSPTLPKGFEVVPMQMGANKSGGDFLSEEWQEAVCAKVQHALAFCKKSDDGDPFIVSDVDIQFFPAFNLVDIVGWFDSMSCDIAFQKERFRLGDTEMNCGFYIARNSSRVRELLETSLEKLKQSKLKNEQSVINVLIPKFNICAVGLDNRFYARTHGFPPPKKIWLHHANWATTVSDKIQQIERVRRIVNGGSLRLYAESYAENLSRSMANGSGLCGLMDTNREYFTRLPLKPYALP